MSCDRSRRTLVASRQRASLVAQIVMPYYLVVAAGGKRRAGESAGG